MTTTSTGSALARQRDLRSLLQTVTDAATGISGARCGAFAYHGSDGAGEPFTLTTVAGASTDEFARFGPTAAGDGVLRYDDALAAHIDSGALLPMDEREREIRASAVQACELLAQRLGVPPRSLDTWLWNRGQGEDYKARPRHRTRTVFY